MPPITLVRLPVLRPILQYLTRIGAPIERYVARAGISPVALQKSEPLIPLRQAIRFLREAAAGEGRSDLALLAGQHATIESLGMYGQLIRRSRTLGDAIGTLVHLAQSFNSGERWWIERSRNTVRLCHRFTEPLGPEDAQVEHYTIAMVVNLIRLAAGPTRTPIEVQLCSSHSPDVPGSPLFHGTRLGFDHPWTTITLGSSLLDEPIGSAQTAHLSPLDVELWRQSAPADDLEGSIRQVLIAMEPRIGHVRIEHAAAALGCSVRTLQRRLADAGSCFEEIVRTMRQDMAADLLQRTDARVLDIALDLGYSDHAHFTRAFRRWTGLPPLEYRRRHRAAPNPSPADALLA
jgi:AraC-like DNA-binding protein